MHQGCERPLFFKCGTSTGGWQRGSLTPQMSPALLPTAAPDCDTGGTKRRPMHPSEIAHSQGHRPIDLYSTNVHAAARFDGEPRG